MLIQILCAAYGMTLLVIVLRLVRRGHLSERNSLLWLIVCFMLFMLSLLRGLIDKIGLALNVYYPPAFLFLCGFLFCTTFLLYITVVVSKLTQQNTTLAQHIGLLETELKTLRNSAAPTTGA